MYPHSVTMLGARLTVWDLLFLLGVAAGYVVLLRALRVAGVDAGAQVESSGDSRRGSDAGTGGHPRADGESRADGDARACGHPRADAPPEASSGTPTGERGRVHYAGAALALQFVATVYIATLGAQLFAYALDLKTTLVPPYGRSWLAYYLNPVAGPKTLFGAIVVLPVAVAATQPLLPGLSRRRLLDVYTPVLMTILAAARLGCLAQGCCYGVVSGVFGLRYPVGSVVYYEHLHSGLIVPGQPSLPVVPTQLVSAAVLLGLAAWSYRQLVRRRARVFARTVAAYCVFRFAIELVRADVGRNSWGYFSTSQWIAVVVLAAAVASHGVRAARPRVHGKGPGPAATAALRHPHLPRLRTHEPHLPRFRTHERRTRADNNEGAGS